jgi:CelD/BcsL family acetyltransferase involved in cellulose biosynthesis
MDVTLARATELTGAHVALWSRLQDEDPALASPFFHPEFTAAVADARSDVYVAVMEDAGSVVGFLPFQRGRLPIGAPVGGGRSNYHGVIAPAGVDWDPVSLIRASGLRIWDFHHLLVSQRPFSRFHTRISDSFYVDISEGFDAYAGARRQAGSRLVPRVREKARRMEREVGPLRLEPHAADIDVLRTMMSWKSLQYRRTGMIDNFAIDWNVRLLERLHATQADGFEGMLVALYAGETLVAVDMGLRSRHVFHSWFPAYNEELARYSPGLVLFLLLLESAQSLGLRTIDLGKDYSLYKERMATGGVPLAEGSVLVPSPVATARRARRAVEHVVRRTPLSEPARGALRRVRSLGAKRGFSAANSL